MLQPVQSAPLRLASYDEYADPPLLAQVRALAAALAGLRVVHVNATADGGGVAEILKSLVPLLRALGLHASWYVLPPDEEFFAVTKRMHNWLQGAPGKIGLDDRRTYHRYLQQVAAHMADLPADLWIVHDPQPLAL